MDSLYHQLMDNCSITIVATTKTLQRGRHGVEKQRLSEEIGKLKAIIEIMDQRNLIDLRTINSNYLKYSGKYKRELCKDS